MSEPTEAEVIAMAEHPLHDVWAAAVAAVTSGDFRLPDGSLNEGAYVRYALRVLREVLAVVERRGWDQAIAALRDHEAWVRWLFPDVIPHRDWRTNELAADYLTAVRDTPAAEGGTEHGEG